MIISGTLAAALLASAAAAAATTVPALAAAPSTGDYNSCGYYPTTTVHLRTGPGPRYTSTGLLGKDDGFDVDREKDGWYHVTLSNRSRSGIPAGKTGWLAKKYAKPAVCMQLD
ncbi:SH3 domain-containing protein [Streptomyces solicathayae]|uniref:SH3 domain-containing protein n=1 Tax=Streptomyces solicathayae TaxID=3081768 RepID=A0ABZ0LLM1_9ACTN|nr:SH3 domain-containing protein [Streptomyces sp. HUAS YS2]WOX20076.1 SH3 domain-containing protein [Streptomyces sp. HUAS YS2]